MSGLLLIDCEKWRSENTLLSIMKKAKELKDYPDQEILNCTFEKKYKHLDPKYCVIYKIMDEVYTEEEIARLIKEQVIVHYPGDGSSKPWNNPFLPSYKYFFKALKKTPYKRFVFLNQLSFCFKTLLGKFGKKKAS